ncbi:MAG: isoprenylcysteine carboxylmethyltransferase family protein [Candidatus Brocadiaceae bacterium]
MKSVTDSVMFKHRGFVGVICLLPVGITVIFSSPFIAENSLTDFITDVLGWFCFGLYVTFRIWATLYVGGRKDKELQTQGPYSVTRNPLYLGTFCFALSISFFLESISLVVATILAIAIYSRWVIATEEEVLSENFWGHFFKFMSKTPAYSAFFSLLCCYRFCRS